MTVESSVRLAGFALAHAAWSISDLTAGKLLTPFVITEDGGARELMRFEAPTQDEAVAEGKRAVEALGPRVDAWAFARDGLLRMRGSDAAQHVLVVEFGSRDGDPSCVAVQPYEPFGANQRFRILGDPMVTRGGELLVPQEAAALLALLQDGVGEHPAVSESWAEWRA